MTGSDYHNLQEHDFSISVKINDDGNLEVIDITPYEEWFDDYYEPIQDVAYHHIIERVIYIDNENTEVAAFYDKNVESYADLRHSTVYKLEKDGHYYYQKVILPTSDHPMSGENEHLYYEDGFAYYVDEDEGIEKKLDLKEDFDDIYGYALGNPVPVDNCFCFSADVFSIYDLLKCYLLKERDRINNYFKNGCNSNCTNQSNIDFEIDILLAAVLVIQHLIEDENYFEAQRILNGLLTCGNLCKDYSNNLKGCGCGKN